ncbi:hypothetical protein [Nocardioides conyzicola]|uniref:Secreted protein n=1 Tax=Nocardioides conyzicola TaxID=1651781 RepID=A0ABP8XGR0_9ACTN
MPHTVTTTDRPLRRLVLAAAVLGVLVLSACGSESSGGGDGGDGETGAGGDDVSSSVRDGGEPADPTGPAARPDADFSAEVTVSDDAVRVTYRLVNRSGGELLVPDQLADENAEYDGDTSRAYVTGADGGVVVSQRVFPQPDTDRKDWAQAPKVQATRLAAGETLQGSVEVARPLVRVQPFGDELGYGTIALPDPAADARFCLGVLAPPYPPSVDALGQQADPLIDHSNQVAAGQYLFCSDPVPLDEAG